MAPTRPLTFGFLGKRLAAELAKARLAACDYDRIDHKAERPAFSPGNPWGRYYWTLERIRLMQR